MIERPVAAADARGRLTDQGGTTLGLLIPGIGYSCDMPLLYYCRQAMLAAGYDVLQTGYQAVKDPTNLDPAIAEAGRAATALLAAVDRPYRRIVIAGKSVGTAAGARLALAAGRPCPQIVLTPVAATLRLGLAPDCVVLAGTADRFLSQAALLDAIPASDPRLHLYPGASHSLLINGDAVASAAILLDAVGVITAFLRQLG